MDNSYNNLWAKLVSLYPNQENIDLLPNADQANQHQVDGEWKIYQNPTGETKIVCLSSSCLKVDNEWLGMNQEMKLLGGEMIAFSEQKNKIDDCFDYVFCLSNENSEKSENSGDELKRKRNENEESKFNLLTTKVQKFQGDINEELICAICINTISNCVTLSPCLHSFCNDCVIRFRKSSTECPTCRQRIHFANKNPFITKLIGSIKSTFSSLGEAKRNLVSKQISRPPGIPKVIQDEKGEIVDGEGEGKGRMFYENGNLYEGMWKNGKREGYGQMWYFDKDFYKGHWKDGKREGYGEMKYSDGDIYQGYWKNNKQEGEGSYSFKDGDCYSGNWRRGKMFGKGKVIYKDGGVYEGQMKDLDRHGEGVLVLNNKDVVKGSWKKDILQLPVKIDYANGDKYAGDVSKKGFQREGYGALISKDGIILDGVWKLDKLPVPGYLI